MDDDVVSELLIGAIRMPQEGREGDERFEMLMMDGYVANMPMVDHMGNPNADSSRSWIMRRVVWTADCIYLAREDEDAVIDSIPLAETEKITASDQVEKSTNKDMTVRNNNLDKEKAVGPRKVYPESTPLHATETNGSNKRKSKGGGQIGRAHV